MKTNAIQVQKCQIGWRCEWFYSVATIKQCTNVNRSHEAGSRFFVIAILKSWWQARHLASIERAKPGEREVAGWSE